MLGIWEFIIASPLLKVSLMASLKRIFRDTEYGSLQSPVCSILAFHSHIPLSKDKDDSRMVLHLARSTRHASCQFPRRVAVNHIQFMLPNFNTKLCEVDSSKYYNCNLSPVKWCNILNGRGKMALNYVDNPRFRIKLDLVVIPRFINSTLSFWADHFNIVHQIRSNCERVGMRSSGRWVELTDARKTTNHALPHVVRNILQRWRKELKCCYQAVLL